MIRRMKKQTKFVLFLTCVGFVLFQSACLKTRAQLKEEEDSSRSEQTSKADLSRQSAVDELKSEFNRMGSRLEELERAQHNERDTEKMKKLEERIQELEAAQMKMLEALKKVEGSIPPPDPVDSYKKGLEDFKAGRLDEALKQFTVYLAHPDGKYKQDALFYRGETYFGLKQYKKAIVDFSKFPETYHSSDYLPKALLKVALSFEALGMKDDSAAFYQELFDKYPKTPEGKTARQKILASQGKSKSGKKQP